MSVVALVRRRPLVAYFALVFAFSALALGVIGLPSLHGGSGRPTVSLAMFPVMVVGVGLTGIGLTYTVGGRGALRGLRSRLAWPADRRWLLVLAVPPVAILAVLGFLRATVSAQYSPGFLLFGVAAGLFAGFFEELGWSGFAYPRMRARLGALRGALVLGGLWALWHLPVVDSLGAASPHGRYWPEFFAAFAAILVALRVLIAWVYTNTGSLRMAQLLHASSTGFLVLVGAPHATPAQEALWYAAYAAVLHIAVGVVVVRSGTRLTRGPSFAEGLKTTAPAATINL